MTVALIAAHDPDLVIGKGGELPWHYTDDLKYFKRTTMGHPIVMGRKVFEELDEQPLPGRKNVVLSRIKKYEHVDTFTSIDEALDHLKDHDVVFIIGGGEIYSQTISKADKLFITEIHERYEGDTYFPEYRDKIGTVWREIKREDQGPLSFVVYEKIKN